MQENKSKNKDTDWMVVNKNNYFSSCLINLEREDQEGRAFAITHIPFSIIICNTRYLQKYWLCLCKIYFVTFIFF